MRGKEMFAQMRMTLPADPNTDNLLSPVIRNENGESMPAAILRELPGNNESMRHGVVGTGKNQSRFVRVPAAVVNVEIKPVSFSQNLCLRFVEYTGSRRRETFDMAPGCMLQWDAREIDDRIDSVAEVATDLLVNTEDNAMIRRIDKPRGQNISNPARQYEIVVPLAFPQH